MKAGTITRGACNSDGSLPMNGINARFAVMIKKRLVQEIVDWHLNIVAARKVFNRCPIIIIIWCYNNRIGAPQYSLGT